MAERFGAAEDTGGRGIQPRTILAPVLAWLAVACVLGLYLNQRGRWRSRDGLEAYRDCFGSTPAEGLRLQNAASFRHYRYTGELLAMECYAQVEGEFDSAGWPGSGKGWRSTPSLGDEGGSRTLLAGHGLSRAPEWFLRSSASDSAHVVADDQGRWFYVHVFGSRELLIAGGRQTQQR
jgi:hypothetical protein